MLITSYQKKNHQWMLLRTVYASYNFSYQLEHYFLEEIQKGVVNTFVINE